MWSVFDEDEIIFYIYFFLEILVLVGTSVFFYCYCVLCSIYCNKKDLIYIVLFEYVEEKCIFNLLFKLIYKNIVYFILFLKVLR